MRPYASPQVANGGGGEALAVDALGRLLRPQYAQRVAYHEAGHLLVAYLVGLLPRAYTLSSLDAFIRWAAGEGRREDRIDPGQRARVLGRPF